VEHSTTSSNTQLTGKHSVRIVFLITVLIGLNGCFSRSVKNFAVPASSSHFDLSQDVGGLRAGHYVAELEDTRFTYYTCGGKCVDSGNFDLPGGICFPKPGVKEPPRLWIYISQSKENLGLLINALDKMEAGRIRVLEQNAPPVSEQLLTKIQVKSG
jgi:hypothetical protein